MEDLHDVRVLHQLIERRKVETLGQRVDQNRVFLPLTRARQLHHAKLRPIGALAQKLGIDRDVRVFGILRTDVREDTAFGYHLHGLWS